MQKMYLVCGIPVSGKTSVAKDIAFRENAVMLSYQEIKEELYGPDIRGERDREVYTVLMAMFDKALEKGRNIVIDSMNGSPLMRKRYAIQAKKHGCKTICVYCHKHYAYAMTANRLRGDSKYRDNFIINAFEKFVPPERHEGWHDIQVLDGNHYSIVVEGQIPVERRTEPRKRRNRGQSPGAPQTGNTIFARKEAFNAEYPTGT